MRRTKASEGIRLSTLLKFSQRYIRIFVRYFVFIKIPKLQNVTNSELLITARWVRIVDRLNVNLKNIKK